MMDSTAPTASRRWFVTALASVPLVLGAGHSRTAQAAPRAFGTGTRSGLSWHSGSSISQWSQFETYRGRKIDTISCWCQHDTWDQLAALKGGFTTAKKSPARVSVAIAPLPKSHDGKLYPNNWKLAASGTFDGYCGFRRSRPVIPI
jgi:hypothetical protein